MVHLLLIVWRHFSKILSCIFLLLILTMKKIVEFRRLTWGSFVHQQKFTARNHFFFFLRVWFFFLNFAPLFHLGVCCVINEAVCEPYVNVCAACQLGHTGCCQCACVICSSLHLLVGWPGSWCQALAWSGLWGGAPFILRGGHLTVSDHH